MRDEYCAEGHLPRTVCVCTEPTPHHHHFDLEVTWTCPGEACKGSRPHVKGVMDG